MHIPLGKGCFKVRGTKEYLNKLKARLIQTLRRIKRDTNMGEGTYRTMHLTKIYKTGTSLRPIVSSRCSVTCEVAKVLTKVLKPLIGKLPHHIKSTRDFVNRDREVILLPGECLNSYDVSALFTSVPTDPALSSIKDLLEQDYTLCDRSVLSVQNIIVLLGFCLHNIYFSFQNKFYEQVEGVAMGSPVSPIVTNLYMEHFEREAFRSASNPPGFGLGLWMTLLSSSNRPINSYFWII